MDRFIHTENVKIFRKQLSDPEVDKNPERRALLVRLLTFELAKEADS